MPNVILHIGQSKTGTSSIQTLLHRNREKLREKGYWYPAPQHVKENHRYLVPLVRDRDHISQMTINALGFSYDEAMRIAAQERKTVVEQCRERKFSSIVFSTETLFNAIEPHERNRLQAVIEEIGGNLRILAYLRNPSTHYMSQCQQQLKRNRRILRPKFNWVLSVIDSYSSDPRGKVECRAFDRKSLLNGNVVDDFLDWSNLEIDLPNSGRLANESISAEGMAVLHRLGLPDTPTIAADAAYQKRLLEEVRAADIALPGATRPVLNPEVADFIERMNTDAIELRDRHGVVFSDLDYSIVGRTQNLACPDFSRIENICGYNKARLSVLEAEVKNRLNPSLVTRVIRRLRVQTNNTLRT